MMDEPHIVTLAFGTVLSTALKVSVNKQVRILGKVVHQAGADRKDLFVVIDIIPIDFSVRNLVEPVAINTEAQLFWQDFVCCGKIGMDGISRLEIDFRGNLAAGSKLIIPADVSCSI